MIAPAELANVRIMPTMRRCRYRPARSGDSGRRPNNGRRLRGMARPAKSCPDIPATLRRLVRQRGRANQDSARRGATSSIIGRRFGLDRHYGAGASWLIVFARCWQASAGSGGDRLGERLPLAAQAVSAVATNRALAATSRPNPANECLLTAVVVPWLIKVGSPATFFKPSKREVDGQVCRQALQFFCELSGFIRFVGRSDGNSVDRPTSPAKAQQSTPLTGIFDAAAYLLPPAGSGVTTCRAAIRHIFRASLID